MGAAVSVALEQNTSQPTPSHRHSQPIGPPIPIGKSKDSKKQNINKELENKNAKLKASEKSLSDKLGRHDIGVLAETKPTLVEKVLNNASVNANRCIEIVSGAELTEKELNATKPSEINAECWRIANPNFDPEAQSDAWKEKNL